MRKFLFVLLALFSSLSVADDIEIYLGNPDANQVRPNVLFIFDTSGSMRENVNICSETKTRTVEQCIKRERVCTGSGRNRSCSNQCVEYESYEEEYCARSTTKTRLAITQEAAKNTIENLSGINLALMQFDDKTSGNHSGGYMDMPMKSIDNTSHKQGLLSRINSYSASTWTPIVEAVHEAYLFMTGGNVKHAKGSVSCGWNCTNNQVFSHAETYIGNYSNANYISPITESCQRNHIVLFTDGASTNDGASDSNIRSLMSNNFSADDLAETGLGFSCTTNNTGTEGRNNDTSCLKDMAYVMNNIDASSLDGKQTVQFHAIGGFIGGSYQETLDVAAKLGGGVSANAQTPEELEAALLKVFQNIVQSSGTFSAPAVAVNAFNSLEQLDQMYYSVFQPHEAVGWSGNVKRYRMHGGKIVDVQGNDAVDPETGFFKENARSFWSTLDDGDKITVGGMASRFQNERIVVSNLLNNNLMEINNRIESSNPLITRDLMGTRLRDAHFEGSDVDPDINTGLTDPYDANEFTKLVNWVGGLEAKDNATNSRRSMEDPLHSTPVLLNYGELSIDGERVPDSTLFVGTNSGYLHAFDTHAEAPKERFSFIPKELLPVATKYYERVGVKRYGLDGHISVWHNDTNKDRIINGSEKAYLYIGMRRGGSSYYALDVSDRDNPKLLWQINGKGHQNGPTTGFEELGQSWSRMVPIDILWNGAKRKALVFAGGYDLAEDTRFTRTDHNVGNAIYMVDATSGALLWKASKTTGNLRIADMKSAITGNVVPVDDNSDGYVDLLYVADLGGRIFRIDFNNAEAENGNTNANNYATGGMIADLGQDNSQGEHVRFFETLDVVYSREFSYIEGAGETKRFLQKPRYMLSIGSGYRAHPLDNSAQDNFYVVFDYNVSGPARNDQGNPVYSAVNKSDLQGYAFGASNELNIKPTAKSNNGFYLQLINADEGEKVLSSSITLNNVIYFTSFRPSTGEQAGNSCTADTGNSRLYSIALSSGDNSLIHTRDINTPGIPAKPVVIVSGPGDGDDNGSGDRSTHLLISTELIDIDGEGFPFKKTFWRELPEQPTAAANDEDEEAEEGE